MKRTSCLPIFLISLVSVFLFSINAHATIREVGTGKPNTTIQSAINASSNGDTVLVYPGTYAENISFNGKAITVKSTNGPSVTTINGNGDATVVLFTSGENAQSVLEGFTIKNGGGQYGGGIYCEGTSPTVNNCIITGNTATYGGGISCINGSFPAINNCPITSNTSISGGGIYCGSSSPIITNCTIVGNSAETHGGGISCESDSSPIITNCTITGNTAGTGGGISCFYSSFPTITNCTISRNSAVTHGGGISCNTSSPTVKNTILWENTATTSENEVYLNSSSISVTYSDVMGGWAGTGNINANPLFVGEGNYHLQTGSPCINTGASAGAPAIDIEGTARPQGSGYDMGAYEYVLPITTTTVVTTSTIITTSSTSTSSTTTTAIPITLEVGSGKPYTTIQSAINAASNGDTVLVYTGFYSEHIDFLGKAITVKSVNGPANTQILYGSNYDLYLVTFENGEGPGSILDGFSLRFWMGIYCIGSSPTITNCIIFGGDTCMLPATKGIGIYCSTASPTITNCTITHNCSYASNSAGGGIYCTNQSSPTIANCTIKSNSAKNGGGISCFNSSPTIKNCTITQNAAEYGGGISCQGYSSPTITNCTITGNGANSFGGGIDCLMGMTYEPVITNSIIAGNYAGSSGGGIAYRNQPGLFVANSPKTTNCTITGNTSQYGGGMYFSEITAPVITNCTISGNSATSSGGGICSYSLYGPMVKNSILWGDNSPNGKEIYSVGGIGVTYSDVDDGWTGTGNMNANPLFVGGGDYHLQTSSPCIDTGTNNGAPATDIAGTPRPQGVGYDMGAYEFSTDSDNDGLFDWQDNCPAVCNPQQLDADNDGIGDVCDTSPGCGSGCGQAQCEQACPPPITTSISTSTTTSIPDTDSDGFLDNADNCPTICNSQQLDADSDGIGDVCDDPNNDGCGGCGQPGCETPC